MNRKFPCPRMLEANNNQASPSAKIGTVELTGLDIIKKMAEGQCFAQASASPETMPALVLKRSSRVIPGFLGTPTKFRCQIVRFRQIASPNEVFTIFQSKDQLMKIVILDRFSGNKKILTSGNDDYFAAFQRISNLFHACCCRDLSFGCECVFSMGDK